MGISAEWGRASDTTVEVAHRGAHPFNSADPVEADAALVFDPNSGGGLVVEGSARELAASSPPPAQHWRPPWQPAPSRAGAATTRSTPRSPPRTPARPTSTRTTSSPASPPRSPKPSLHCSIEAGRGSLEGRPGPLHGHRVRWPPSPAGGVSSRSCASQGRRLAASGRPSDSSDALAALPYFAG